MMTVWAVSGRLLHILVWPASNIALRTSVRARVVIKHQDEILVVKNWLGAGKWALPGGGIEQAESPRGAAVREIIEELGITLDSVLLRDHGRQNYRYRGLLYRCHMFSIELSEKPKIIRAKLEIIDAQWLTLTDLAQQGTEPDVHWATEVVY